jgi:hypothetical protein
MRGAVSAFLTLLLLAAPAFAQEATWSEVQEAEGIYSIVYGVPDSDDARIFVSCETGADTVHISWHADSEKPAGMETGADGMRQRLEGQTFDIRFADGSAAESERIEDAAFQPEEMSGGIFIEFDAAKHGDVLRRFRSSSEAVLVLAGTEAQPLDLSGADAALGKLLTACG